jgi:hypothetical protein
LDAKIRGNFIGPSLGAGLQTPRDQEENAVQPRYQRAHLAILGYRAPIARLDVTGIEKFNMLGPTIPVEFRNLR